MTLLLGIGILILGAFSLAGFFYYARRGFIWQTNTFLISACVFIYGGVYFTVKM